MPQGIVVILRSSLAFLSLLIMTRAMGKKLIAHLSFLEYAAGITIGSIAASMSVDLSVETMPSLIGLLTWSLWVIVMGLVTRYSRPLRRIIDGEPTVVIQNGRILKENLRRLNYHVDDLRMQLRQMAVFCLSDAEFALLEPNGSLSVLKKSQLLPLTTGRHADPDRLQRTSGRAGRGRTYGGQKSQEGPAHPSMVGKADLRSRTSPRGRLLCRTGYKRQSLCRLV